MLDEQLFCSYRDGYAEEMYLRCSCSPLVDDLGGVGGVVVTLAETTERMLSVRRTAALRDVAEEAPGGEAELNAGEAASRAGLKLELALGEPAHRAAQVTVGRELAAPFGADHQLRGLPRGA